MAEREGFYLLGFHKSLTAGQITRKFKQMRHFSYFPLCLYSPFSPASRTDFRILWTGWTGSFDGFRADRQYSHLVIHQATLRHITKMKGLMAF